MVGLVLAGWRGRVAGVVVAGRHIGGLLHGGLVREMVPVLFRRIRCLSLVGMVDMGDWVRIRYPAPCDPIDDDIRFDRIAETNSFGLVADIFGGMEPSAVRFWRHIRSLLLCMFRFDVYGGPVPESVVFGAGGRLFVRFVDGGSGVRTLVLVQKCSVSLVVWISVVFVRRVVGTDGGSHPRRGWGGILVIDRVRGEERFFWIVLREC